MKAVDPNPGHYAFAEWEKQWRRKGREFQLITQNIDNLHGRSGSTDIIELHGNIWHVRPLHGPMSDAFLWKNAHSRRYRQRMGRGECLGRMSCGLASSLTR
jgi:NAD-dependent SIR2 family protein deacetylase